MKLKDAIAYCLYKIYNRLWNAPTFVLDLFIPFLTTNTQTYYRFECTNSASTGYYTINCNFADTSTDNCWLYLTDSNSNSVEVV